MCTLETVDDVVVCAIETAGEGVEESSVDTEWILRLASRKIVRSGLSRSAETGPELASSSCGMADGMGGSSMIIAVTSEVVLEKAPRVAETTCANAGVVLEVKS